MRNAIKKGTVLVAAAVLLAGCGEPLAALTEKEEAIVVNYSAGILAKHNSYQQEGMTALYPEEEEPEEEETEKPKEKKEEQDDASEKDQKKDQKKAESEKKDQKNEDQKKTEQNKEDQAQKQPEVPSQVTLTQALAVPGMEFSYRDYAVVSNYRQGDYFSLDPQAGKVFVLLNVNISNTGDKDAECDVLTKQPVFTLKLNGEAGVENEVTILANDLSTYVAALKAGQTEEAILLFQVPEKTAQNISSLQLSVTINEKTNEIILK